MVSAKQAAKFLGVSASLLYELVSSREIAHHRIRSKLLFDESDLAAFKQRCRVVPKGSDSAPRRPVVKHLKL
jgi:excisionase family DNA binding protein